MKNIYQFNLIIILIFFSTFLKANCKGVTLDKDDTCFFTIQTVEEIEITVNNTVKKDGKITINTSFNLDNYNILFYKVPKDKYDDEGRPIIPLFVFFSPYITLKAGSGTVTKDFITRIDSNHFSITGSGHYVIKLEEDGGDVHWKQLVYVPYPKPANYISLAKKYVPTVVFGKQSATLVEEYLPLNINDIMIKAVKKFNELNPNTPSDPNAPLNIKSIVGAETYSGINLGLKTVVDINNFLTNRGSSDFTLLMDNDILKNVIRETTDKATVYFDVIEIGDFIYLSYYYLYIFDPKSGTSFAPGAGAHSLDRESLIITLDNKTRKPLSVTYGSHLKLTDSDFFGCTDEDFINCEQANNRITKISDGKVKLNWNNIPKQGNHIVIYAAKGSHALFPAYGWYEVLGNSEIAGNTDTTVTWYANQFKLIEIDPTSVFAFSGFWVNATFSSKFPPFIRNPETWAVPLFDSDNNKTLSDIDSCLEKNISINSLDCPRLKKYFPEVPTGIDGVLIKGRITNFANAGFGNDLILHYSGTDIEEILDASGNFSFIVRIAQLKETTDLELNDNLNNLGVIKGNQTRYYHIPDDKIDNIAVGDVIDVGDLDFSSLPVGQSIIGCI